MSAATSRTPSSAPTPAAGRGEAAGRLIKDRYRIVRLIGRGAMGNVYEVLHERLRSPFALKQLRAELDSEPSIVARFRHEAEMMARLAHPNIVRVFDIDTEPGFGTWIAMELVHGEDLGAVMRRLGPLSAAEAIRLGGEIAAALACAHRAGLVHRDIKPANVLVEDGTGRAVLTDFGIAKSVAAGEASEATGTGVFLGTYRYSSPEQIRNQRGVEIDHRADVYSLGVVLYEMVSGRKFLDGLSEGEIVGEVGFRADWTPPLRYDQPPPAALASLIEACVAPRRDHRIATAGEVVERLATCAAELGAGAVPARAPAPPPRGAEPTAATIALPRAAHPAGASAIHSAMRADAVAPGVAVRTQRRGRRLPAGALVALAALLAVAGAAAWIFPAIRPVLGIGAGADHAAIRTVQPEDKVVWLTRGEPRWFSVALEGVDPEQPPRMRWLLNDKVVAEGTTTWEYEPKVHLADLIASGAVRFVVGSGRRPYQTHIWATQTELKDLSPVLQSASYKPGSTIQAAPGERIEITVDAVDPDGSPLTYSWRVDGRRVGSSGPRLVIDATVDAKVTLAVSDGEATVSSNWRIAVAGVRP